MQTIELGPAWQQQPEETAPGQQRYWLRSRRYGVEYSEDGGWCVVDAEGRATHGDLLPDPAEACRLAEQLDRLHGTQAAAAGPDEADEG
jgi:hypothetical protein